MSDIIIYFDIETHRGKEYDELTNELAYAFERHLWDSKSYEKPSDHYKEISALHPEFSQVMCASLGVERNGQFVTHSYSGKDEKKILEDLSNAFYKFGQVGNVVLCGHNIIGFDIPYMAKRYIISKMKIPAVFNTLGKKPWEINHIDTMNLWKFGGWGNVSLQVAAAALGVVSKATEYLGENLYTYDMKDLDFKKVEEYCESDIYATYMIHKAIMRCI